METKIIDTVRSAVQKLGVLAVGEELPQAEFRDGLVALNRVVDSYNTSGIFIGHTLDINLEAPYINNRCDIPAPTDEARRWKNKVTFGKCGDYTLSPVDMVSLYFRQSNTDYPMRNMSENEYGGIAVKDVEAIPNAFLFKQDANGLKALYFDYIPQANLRLLGSIKVKYTGSNSQGKPFNAIDTVEWDEGIEAMLVYRLAIELAPDYGVKDISVVASMLDRAESDVFSANAPQYLMEVEGSYLERRGKGLRYNRARY